MSLVVGTYLLSNNNVEIVLSLVDVRCERHNARNTSGVCLGRTHTRRVHDTVLGAAEEIGGTTKTVEHSRSHHAGTVGVGVDVNFNGGVHADTAKSADDLRRVGNLLGAQEKLSGIVLPVVVEALKAVWGETDGSRRGEVEVSTVKEVEERIL